MTATPAKKRLLLRPSQWCYVIAVLVWAVTLVGAPLWREANLSAAATAVAETATQVRVAIFLGTLIGWALIFAALGLDTSNKPLGILAGGRNIYSLSRLQMALWTWLILGSVMAVACCRGWGLGAGDVKSALAITIDGNIFAAMGLSYFTGAATPALLALKAQNSGGSDQDSSVTGRTNETMTVQGQMISRPRERPARLGDLVRGDEVGSAGAIDLSKVQQLMVTVVVLGAYAAMLYDLFATGLNNTPDAHGVLTGRTSLPKFSDDLVKLLLLSHAGYLGYSAVPKPVSPSGPSSDTTLRGPPPSPDRNAGLS